MSTHHSVISLLNTGPGVLNSGPGQVPAVARSQGPLWVRRDDRLRGVADHAADLQQHLQRDQHQVRAQDRPGPGLPPRLRGHRQVRLWLLLHWARWDRIILMRLLHITIWVPGEISLKIQLFIATLNKYRNNISITEYKGGSEYSHTHNSMLVVIIVRQSPIRISDNRIGIFPSDILTGY